MTSVSLLEAQAHLSELIHRLAPGGEVVVTENGQPVARIVAEHTGSPKPALGTRRVQFPLHHSRQSGVLSDESIRRAEEQMTTDEDVSHADVV